MEKTKRNYGYSDTDMLSAALVIVLSFKKYIDKLSYINLNWTQEFADGLEARVLNTIKNYISEPFKHDLEKATKDLIEIQEKSIFLLQVTKTFIEEYCINSDDILNKLGYDELWEKVDQLKEQSSLTGLLNVFARNINKYSSDILTKGFNPKVLDEISGYSTKMIYANAKQEELKSASIDLKEGAVVEFNKIYDEIISICKVAQRLFADNPTLKDRFVFNTVVERDNHITTTNGENTEEIIEE